jgi:uroporphyrinogen decarboxylase
MTSRERVLLALNHKEPDRVPITFGGTSTTSIIESVPDGRGYTNLCKYLGIKDFAEPVISDVYNLVGNIDERLQDALGSDFRCISPDIPPSKMEKDGTKTWEALCGYRIKRVGYYDEPFDYPFRNWTSKKDIDAYPLWPDTASLGRAIIKNKVEEAELIWKEKAFAIVADSYFSAFPFNAYAELCGMDKWLVDMKLNEDFYFALSDKLLEIGTALNGKFFEAIGKYCDIAVIYDDLGTQQATLMSPADYRKFVKPYTGEVIANIRRHTDARILMHSCGAIHDFIPDLIELGVEILNPVQPLAKNMEPSRLKREFGSVLCFCGGIDTQRLLPFETPPTIELRVAETLQIYAPGGGYIFGPSQSIQPDVPSQNVVGMYEAAKKYGNYPIRTWEKSGMA